MGKTVDLCSEVTRWRKTAEVISRTNDQYAGVTTGATVMLVAGMPTQSNV